MKKNWIVTEARRADHSRDVVILEHPDVKYDLDGLLLNRFWPVILRSLKGTGYAYEPQGPPETEFELSRGLERSIPFMLFDAGRAFFKGGLRCSRESWMIENEFYLSLPKETELEVLRDLLGNTRFVGYPPTMMVDKRSEDNFYQIDFRSGKGASWGWHNDMSPVDEQIKRVIETNVAMYQCSKDQRISIHNVGAFLTLAYAVYEAY